MNKQERDKTADFKRDKTVGFKRDKTVECENKTIQPILKQPLQINQVPCILAVTAFILFRFENRLFFPVLKICCFVPHPNKRLY